MGLKIQSPSIGQSTSGDIADISKSGCKAYCDQVQLLVVKDIGEPLKHTSEQVSDLAQ